MSYLITLLPSCIHPRDVRWW